MPIDLSTLSILHSQKKETAKALLKKSEGAQNLGEPGPKADNMASATTWTSTSSLRQAFKKVRHNLVKQTNDALALSNEKSSLLESALSVNSQQLEAAQKLQSLLKNGAEPEQITAAKQRFTKLQEVSQEVEEEVVAHNIESADISQQSLKIGSRQLAHFEVQPIEYRSVSGVVHNSEDVDKTIDDLKANDEQLKVQKKKLADLKDQINQASQAAVDQIDEYSSFTIRTVDEAVAAAQGIADQIAGGAEEFLSAHTLYDQSTVFKLLFEDD